MKLKTLKRTISVFKFPIAIFIGICSATVMIIFCIPGWITDFVKTTYTFRKKSNKQENEKGKDKDEKESNNEN